MSEHYVRVTWKDTREGPELVEVITLPNLKNALEALRTMQENQTWRQRLDDHLVVRIELLPLARMGSG